MGSLRATLEAYGGMVKTKLVTEEPSDGQLWFRHTNERHVLVLQPQTYHNLQRFREGYDVSARKRTEIYFHDMLDHESNDTSFLYATVVGCNKMESPDSYPGYTYFFRLTDVEIEKCIFSIVDKKRWMRATVGKAGLNEALRIWQEHAHKFEPFEEKELGTIDPRIEVIISFDVIPEQYICQQEDR
jgi:hypothetical protein